MIYSMNESLPCSNTSTYLFVKMIHIVHRFSWSTSSKTNCISIDSSAFTSTTSWHYVVLTWDGNSLILYVDGDVTTNGINADFADCNQYTGRLMFGQDGDFTAGSNLGMEQDTVAIYNRAWANSEVFYGRRYVISDGRDLYALWRDSSGKDSTDNNFGATIWASSSGRGITESINFDGWSHSSSVTSISWIFPSTQSTYYFSSANNFALSSKYTIETWIRPYSTSKTSFW